LTFRYLPDVALADIAFEAESTSMGGLFESCADAVTDIMVDPATLSPTDSKEVSLTSEDADRLLYDFLTELIIMKDVDSMLYTRYEVEVSQDGRNLKAKMKGEKIDRVKHVLRNDVKAVTMHMFGILRSPEGWKATVVLDI
jgi:SHS2 domain-containing protein